MLARKHSMVCQKTIAVIVAIASASATIGSPIMDNVVRRDPKVLRSVSRILNKEGLHFANLFYIFE